MKHWFFKIFIFTFCQILLFNVQSIFATFGVPCTQKLVGSKCLFDEECYGTNTVCREGRCTCPTNFEEYDVNDRITVCRLAPSNIGDSCQRDCKPPLLCRDGKCECWGGSVVNGKCVVQCYGTNTVCREGRCTCPTNFEEYDVNDRITVCRLAPSNIGDSCQRDCKPPLLCRDGKCECWGGSVINGKCVVPCPAGQQLYGVECTRVAHWGQTCEKESHCVDPFTSCLGGTCQCAPGTARDMMRNKCYAVCPDNMHPHQSCRRLFLNDIDMLDNAATTDSCPIGFRCVTYGSPYIGHC
uniref:EB domain-containing protein n=1 Tax=Panagrolaimus sp. PS1159 TaxID=55785 RepID=A0AC35GLC9_9BILA